MSNDMSIVIVNFVLLISLCIWSGREIGYVIDRQNRDVGGRPRLVKIPEKWRWLFRFQKQLYTDKYTILRASIILHLLGYMFAIIEIVLLCVLLITEKKELITIAVHVYILYMMLGILCVLMPNSIRYSYYMRKAYDYDWITDYKEQLTQSSKRRCKVVSKLNDSTYEITLGRLGKKKYRANTEAPVEIGEEKFAIHVYHPIDENSPYWIIKNH